MPCAWSSLRTCRGRTRSGGDRRRPEGPGDVRRGRPEVPVVEQRAEAERGGVERGLEPGQGELTLTGTDRPSNEVVEGVLGEIRDLQGVLDGLREWSD